MLSLAFHLATPKRSGFNGQPWSRTRATKVRIKSWKRSCCCRCCCLLLLSFYSCKLSSSLVRLQLLRGSRCILTDPSGSTGMPSHLALLRPIMPMPPTTRCTLGFSLLSRSHLPLLRWQIPWRLRRPRLTPATSPAAHPASAFLSRRRPGRRQLLLISLTRSVRISAVRRTRRRILRRRMSNSRHHRRLRLPQFRNQVR